LSKAVFDQARGERPADVGYALFRDGDSFVHLFVNWDGDTSDAITELASFKAFSKDATDRYLAAPEVVRLALDCVDVYGFGAPKVAGRT
jgi:hypothetical protein